MVTMHASLIDFRFRVPSKKTLLRTSYIEEDETELHTYLDNGILVEKKFLDSELPNKNQQWIPHHIAEFLFFDELGYLNISEYIVHQNFGFYTNILKNVYTKL